MGVNQPLPKRGGLRSRWVVALATAITMAATASLGVWQLNRAQQKLALQAQRDAQAQKPVMDTSALLSASDFAQATYRPASLRGQWLPETLVYLDNRQMNKKNGLIVLMVLRLAGSEQGILVQRGWVPRNFNDRTAVPDINTPTGEVNVQGRLAPPPGQLYQLGEPAAGPIRQNIELTAFAQEKGLRLLPLSLLQTDPADHGLLRDWAIAQVDVSKHHGYAFQWFAMCALAGALYVWFQIIVPRRPLHAVPTPD